MAEPNCSSIPKENSSAYYYFSFGSNMLKERIQINDPNAKPYAAARLDVSMNFVSLFFLFANLFFFQGLSFRFQL